MAYLPSAGVAYVDEFGADPTGATYSDTALAAALASLPTRALNGNIYPVGTIVFGPNRAVISGNGNSRGGYKIQNAYTFGPFVLLQGAGEEATTLFCVDGGTAMTFMTMRTIDGFISDPDTSNGGGIKDMTIDGRYSIGANGTGIGISTLSSTGSPTTVTTTTNHGFTTGQYVLIEGNASAGLQAVVYGIWAVTVTGANTFTIPANNVTSGTPSAFCGLLGPVGLDYGEMHGIHFKGARFQHFASPFAVALLEKSSVSGGGAGNEKMMDNQVTLTNNLFGHYRTSVYLPTVANATYTPNIASTTITDLNNGGGLAGQECVQLNGSGSAISAGTAITSARFTNGPTAVAVGDLMRLSNGTNIMLLQSNSTLAANTLGTVNLVATSGHASHIGSSWTYTVAKLNGGGNFTGPTATANGSSTTTIPVSTTASINPGQVIVDQTNGFGVSPVFVTDVNPANLTITVSHTVSFSTSDAFQFTCAGNGGGAGQTVLQFDAGAAGQISCDNGKYVIVGNASAGSSGNATAIGINTGGTGGSGSTWEGTDLTIDMLAAGGWGSNYPMAFNVLGAQAAYWVGNAEINLQPAGGNAWTASSGVLNGSGTAGNAGLFTCWSGQAANGDTTLNSKVTVTATGTTTLANTITNPAPLSITLGPGMWNLVVEGAVKGGASATQNIELWLSTNTAAQGYTGASTLDMVVIQPALSQWLPFRLQATPQVANPNGGTTQTFYLNTISSASNSAILEFTSPVNSFTKITRMIATPV